MTCQKIRESSQVPIVMVTAEGRDEDKVRGLEMGADDYITKPFSTNELAARVNAVLRRINASKKASLADRPRRSEPDMSFLDQDQGSAGPSEEPADDAPVQDESSVENYEGSVKLVVEAKGEIRNMAENVDPSDPSGDTSTETVNPCGENITITVVQQPALPAGFTTDPIGNPLVTIPPLSSYSNRDFQTSKTVSNANPNGGDSVTYSLTVINRDSTPTTLNEIEDTLPAGFSYDCNATPDQLTLPGQAAQDITPDNAPCPQGNDLEWDMPHGTSIDSGGVVTLTFNAVTSVTPGIYCNEIQVTPGGNKTHSGKSASWRLGPEAGFAPVKRSR